MLKNLHEIRDPIHAFIRLTSGERRVLDSAPVQRLRQIHQLAMSYLVYPGATHRRFEHSLGVLDLSTKIFDAVTEKERVSDDVRKRLPELIDPDALVYWRHVVRMAALCHDIGHLPYSHAAERELLPNGWTHERITRDMILGKEMVELWATLTPPLRAEDVVKVAVGPQKAPDLKFSTWETILSEIIVGDAFGADRMDYLLRDSYHSGVAYGRFDHHRLIDTLRILISPSSDDPALGVEEGGIQSAESLLWARYFMYSQVYFHHIRRIYDIHLQDFLISWLKNGKFSTDVDAILTKTDNGVMAALVRASRNPARPGHESARRIARHEHFRLLYERNPEDVSRNPEIGRYLYEGAVRKFGKSAVRRDSYTQRSSAFDFPVQMKDDRILSSLLISGTLAKIPVVAVDYIYIIPDKRKEAQKWVEENRSKFLKKRRKERGGEA